MRRSRVFHAWSAQIDSGGGRKGDHVLAHHPVFDGKYIVAAGPGWRHDPGPLADHGAVDEDGNILAGEDLDAGTGGFCQLGKCVEHHVRADGKIGIVGLDNTGGGLTDHDAVAVEYRAPGVARVEGNLGLKHGTALFAGIDIGHHAGGKRPSAAHAVAHSADVSDSANSTGYDRAIARGRALQVHDEHTRAAVADIQRAVRIAD